MEIGPRPLLISVFLTYISAMQNNDNLYNGMDLGITYCKVTQRNTGGATIKVEKGDFGYIASYGYPGNYTTVKKHGHLCNVELQACSTCKIRITFVELRFPDCVAQQTRVEQKIRSVCVTGCDHLRLFEVDQPYHRTTERNYYSDAENEVYETISSKVVIQHCMSNTSHHEGKSFYIKYEVIDKIEKISGTVTSPMYSVITGQIRSPNFPFGYVPNGETFTYMIQNLDPYGHVQLVFDDWDLAEKSNIQVYDDLSGPTRATIYGHRKRPTVMSNTNTLVLVFNVGDDKYDCCNHIGFKATYTFVSDDLWRERPRTDCSDSYLLQTGGLIEFQTTAGELPQWFDCVWTIKRYITNFPDSVMLRLAEVNLGKGWFSEGANILEIYEGITSEGRLMAKYTSDNFTAGEILYSPGDGLYIRLRGIFSNADSLKMIFTGVNNRVSGVCPKTAEFMCENLWCIPNELTCDDIDHCGDNSDENPIYLCTNTQDENEWLWSNQILTPTAASVVTTSESSCYGRYLCHDDSACIEPAQLCDGIDHCRDRSDENSCSLYVLSGQAAIVPVTFPSVCLMTSLMCLLIT